jgi:hypothetical protein
MQPRAWLRVSRQALCPVCEKPDWCSVTSDGQAVCCMRVPSDRKARNGGWIHRIGATADSRSLPPPQDRKLMLDCAAYHAALRRRWDWRWNDGLAMDLGVDPDALELLQPAFDAANNAFAFPMRDGAGAVVGIRLRSREGRKWAVRGSREGLFYSPALAQSVEPLVICEGPTDTAAALSLGLLAVGRPSCTSGADVLAALCQRLGVRKVVMLADCDAPHRRPDGSIWYPGRDGAQAFARALRRMWCMVLPPAKDVREWLHAGATRVQFDALINNATWRLG